MTCAGISLLAAPFRSSAGIRAAMLVLALVVLVWLWRYRALTIPAMPVTTRRPLLFAIGLWVLVVAGMSLLGPDPLESLRSWRGDVLTPILAGVVFYCLTQTPRALAIWLLILFASLLVLTVMVVIDPFNVAVPQHEPRYVSVGWLSTWLVMLGALLPLVWLVQWPGRRLAQLIGMAAAFAILLAAWFTASRIIWICFGVMLLIYGVMQLRADRQHVSRVAVIVLAGLVAMAALFYASATTRAGLYPAAADVGTFMWRDNRSIIWAEALGVIAEKPVLGHGYALEAPRQALATRFTDPWFRDVFKHAHNMVLNYAIQLGLVGALTLLILFAALGRTFWTMRSYSEFSRAVSVCGVMLVAGFFLRNMMDDFFSRHAALLFGALVGMLLAVTRWPAQVGSQTDSAKR